MRPKEWPKKGRVSVRKQNFTVGRISPRQSVFGHSLRCFRLVVTIFLFVFFFECFCFHCKCCTLYVLTRHQQTHAPAHANAHNAVKKAICFKEAELIASHANEIRKEKEWNWFFKTHGYDQPVSLATTTAMMMMVIGQCTTHSHCMMLFCIRKISFHFNFDYQVVLFKTIQACPCPFNSPNVNDDPSFDLLFLWTLSTILN